MTLTGLHHVTAVSADIRANHAFYTGALGMRLVKRSVNQDDTSAYHLFYADAVGTPGTDLTFFDWPVPPERRGARSLTRTGLRVDAASLDFWTERLAGAGVRAGAVRERDGRLELPFEDPEGQRLTLVADGGAGTPPVPWDASPVPAAHQIRGLGPVELTVPQIGPTDAFFQRVLGLAPVREFSDAGARVTVYQIGEVPGPHAELHVAVRPDLAPARPGAGGVHHVALRTPTLEAYRECAEALDAAGLPHSGPVDRYYFRSLYVREPGGVLVEIATDEPGFATDEPVEALGERLALPPFLEGRRAQIEAGLKPLG